MLFAE